MWSVTWTVKVSKRCNLRCRYCYEWNELDRPERLTLPQWARLLRVVAAVHRLHAVRAGGPGRSYVVWHGGEPLLLPVSYAKAVLELERAVMGAAGLGAGDYVNVVQTGLYALSPAWTELLVTEGFEVGVSYDVAAGVRVTAEGHPTEERVSTHLDRLNAAGVPVVGAVVLASHTEHRLAEIHDTYAARGMRFQVNLLAPSPALSPGHPLKLTPGRAAAALERLFVHWMNQGCPVEVAPLSTYLTAAMQRRLGLAPSAAPATTWSDRLVVQPDGEVHRVPEGSTHGYRLGNFFMGDTETLLRDPAGGMPRPDPDDLRNAEHARVSLRVMAFIDRQLDRWGFDPGRVMTQGVAPSALLSQT